MQKFWIKIMNSRINRYFKKRFFTLLVIIFLYPTAMINSQDKNDIIENINFLIGVWEFDQSRIDDYFENAVSYQKRNYTWFWTKSEVKKRKKTILNDQDGIPEFTFTKAGNSHKIKWTKKRKDGFNATEELNLTSFEQGIITFKKSKDEIIRFLVLDKLKIEALVKEMDFGIPYKKKN